MNRTLSPVTLLSSAVAAGLLAGAAAISPARAAEAAAVPAPLPPPPPKWETTASLGLTLTKGNSDTLLFTGNIHTLRKWTGNELSAGAGFTYGENSGEKNAQSANGFIQYNRLFSERLFGYARADAMHDDIADIKYRVALSPGVGYYFIKDAKITLCAEVGPGWIIEEKGGTQRNYFTLRLAERFTYKLSDKARLWEMAEYLPEVKDFNNFIVNAEAGIESDLTKKLRLRFYVQDSYSNVPAPGRKKNDVKLVAALGYKF